MPVFLGYRNRLYRGSQVLRTKAGLTLVNPRPGGILTGCGSLGRCRRLGAEALKPRRWQRTYTIGEWVFTVRVLILRWHPLPGLWWRPAEHETTNRAVAETRGEVMLF